jgi:hypothetical protein
MKWLFSPFFKIQLQKRRGETQLLASGYVKIAIEHVPFIDGLPGLPIKNCDFP